MSRILSRLAVSLAAAFLATAGPALDAQCIDLSTLGAAYTQDFASLASSGTSSATPAGWSFSESGTSANTTYTAGTGSSGTGDTYSFGAASNSERALGGVQSGSLNPTIGACFTNDTGSTIGALAISYTGEQWRIGNTSTARDDRLDFQFSSDATSLTSGSWSDLNALDFTNPVKTAVSAGALNGNDAANRTAISSSIACLAIADGATFWIRWSDLNASGSDDGLAVDDLSLTPNLSAGVCLSIDDVTVTEGESGTVLASFTVSLSEASGSAVTFDIATADGTATTADADYDTNSQPGQSIPMGETEYAFDVTVNGDTDPEIYETFLVNVTGVSGAIVADGQGVGTIQTDDPTIVFLHDVQGSGASTPIGGSTVTVEGVVTADFQTQGSGELRGFFLQEEDGDHDGDPQTSEGLFVFCSSCPTAVAEGERVRATGTAGENFNMTQITATSAPAIVVTEGGNQLGDVTATTLDLPIPPLVAVNDFYEPLEGMRVSFSDTLTVAEYFELFRYGQVELFEGGRPRQFCEDNAPDATDYADHLDQLARRRVILDDDDDVQNGPLFPPTPEGVQAAFYPRQNGGFSIGTQGTDFFRGGDQVNGLTGVLHWSWSGQSGTDAWRIRPTAASVPTLTVANPRPAVVAPSVGAAPITAASINVLNYFTTLDTTSSNNSGPCGPSGTQDCRGADSAAELARQRARTALVICTLGAEVVGLVEIENTNLDAINDLVTAVNAQCGGADPYAFASTGGTLGDDAIRVAILYRSATLSPVGSPLVDLDAVHNRPPTAQTLEVIDNTNAAFGEIFTVVVNHFKSKGSCPGSGDDADQSDGQGCWNAARTDQAVRLLTWINGTVLTDPDTAGDPDVLLLGDFNAYAQEDPVATILAGGYTDLMSSLLGTAGYSYLFDGQLGHLDYAFASASLAPTVTGIAPWHINADEVPLFDYNDEIRDTGEATFEEKPDGSGLSPARIVWEPGVPYRAADHDPLLVGLLAPVPAMAPYALTVDDGANDVLEVGESFLVRPEWENLGTAAADDLTGTALGLTGPAGPTYDVVDDAASYGDIAVGANGGCAGTGDCYGVAIAAASRPQAHWDAMLEEELATGETHTWTLHVGDSFADVPTGDSNYSAIETVFHHGIVSGCGGGNHCPGDGLTRQQAALHLARALGASSPAGCIDNAELFADVPHDDPFCRFIEWAADPLRQITLGCGSGNFCPHDAVTRQEAARWVLRALRPTGYDPTGCVEQDPPPYADVPWDHPYCGWIQELKSAGWAASCDGGANFCPLAPIGLAPFAGLVSRAFELELYAP